MADAILEWDSKDPDEGDRFAVDWAARLLPGDAVASSAWLPIVAAGITITNQDFDDSHSFARIDGGNDGEVAEIQISIVTADGYDYEVTRRLAIISSAGAEASGYTVPTPAAFVTAFPRFAATSMSVIQDALTFASSKVDETWTEADFSRALMLYAAHTLTMDGHGAGTDATLAREGLSGFQRIKSGSLEVSQFDRASGGGSGLDATNYGRQFKELLRLNHGGPRIVPGIRARPCSPYATDC